MVKLLTLLILLTGCSQWRTRAVSIVVPEAAILDVKSSEYVEQIASMRDDSGFIMTDKCDSLLFSGLYNAAVNGANILAARDKNSAWHRRPGHDCSPEIGNSRSTISRDMILGLMWSLWRDREVNVAVGLMENLRSNGYVLQGEGTLGELLMTPSMVNTLAHMIEALGGPRYKFELGLRADFTRKHGFVAHLTVWHIALRGDIRGKISEKAFRVLRYHRQRDPLNPLFQAAYHRYSDGNQYAAVQLLLDETHWPNDRLPTTAEHCSPWPIERDREPHDWGSCDVENPRQHTGAELPIIYNLLIAG